MRREGEGRLEIRVVEEDFYEDRKPLVFVVEGSRLVVRDGGGRVRFSNEDSNRLDEKKRIKENK